MKKAADDMKAEQERKAQERRRILEERIGSDLHSGASDEKTLADICKRYHDRIRELEDSRYDLEVKVRAKDYEVRIPPGFFFFLFQKYSRTTFTTKLTSNVTSCRYLTYFSVFQLNELTIQVNDLRGKFVKPTLKKVSKYETK